MSFQAIHDEIQARMRERQQEITRLKREQLVDEAGLLKVKFDEIFEQHPGLQLIGWSQYTEAEYNDEGGYTDYTSTTLKAIRVDGITVDADDREENMPSGVRAIFNTVSEFFDHNMYDYSLSEMFGPDSSVAATRHGITPVEYDVDLMDLHPDFNVRPGA